MSNILRKIRNIGCSCLRRSAFNQPGTLEDRIIRNIRKVKDREGDISIYDRRSDSIFVHSVAVVHVGGIL